MNKDNPIDALNASCARYLIMTPGNDDMLASIRPPKLTDASTKAMPRILAMFKYSVFKLHSCILTIARAKCQEEADIEKIFALLQKLYGPEMENKEARKTCDIDPLEVLDYTHLDDLDQMLKRFAISFSRAALGNGGYRHDPRLMNTWLLGEVIDRFYGIPWAQADTFVSAYEFSPEAVMLKKIAVGMADIEGVDWKNRYCKITE